MSWRDDLVERLARAVPCGYELAGPPATEPTSLAAIALAAYGRGEQSRQALDWLGSIQNDDGSIGPMASINSPGWPTPLAMLATAYAGRDGSSDVFGLRGDRHFTAVDEHLLAQTFNQGRALRWLLETKGSAHERWELLGHDSTLVGWPWVVGTHSWAEPTALAVLALKSAGQANHPRTREAVRLLEDRLLPDGGCNYGNTTVLGQALRPHLGPTGLVLLALFGERDDDGRVERSLDYLQQEVNAETAAVSLSYAVWGLARHGRTPPGAPNWLAAASKRRSTQNSPHRMALLLLASAAADVANHPVPNGRH